MILPWTSCSIPSVWMRTLDRFEDARGENVVLDDGVLPDGVSLSWVHDNCSVSSRRVLRGIHTDTQSWRMMTCLVGRVWFAIVDCRMGIGFGGSEMITLSDSARRQVLLPPAVGAAFYVLSEQAVVHYKW